MLSVLSVKNLTKDFKGFRAIDDVSFDVEEGEIFGLLGPNGAGKTTTIRVISTVLVPTKGTAEVLGNDIVKNPQEVRKNIGVLTTDIGIYERFSGRENLRYFGQLYGLAKQELEERIDLLSKLLDMDAFVDRKAGKYSTGMKQKLAIARSVIHDPKVIIFDEPTLGLDVLASKTVREFMIHAKRSGKSVIFSTHQMHDAEKMCDRMAIIHRGKLIANDTVHALKLKTETRDLEDAFLKLVKDKNYAEGREVRFEEKKGSKISSDTKTKLASTMLVAIGFLVIEFGLLGNSSSIAGYGLIMFGAVVYSIRRYFSKN